MQVNKVYSTILKGARTLLVAPGITTSNKKLLLLTKGIATSSKKLLGSDCIPVPHLANGQA